MAENNDIPFMRRALELAKNAWGQTHPNPMVGAVIVKDGKVIGEGFHHHDGGAHAEINAIKSLEENPKNAEIYVTLEPCSTRGRTGACSDAIIAAGISRVVIGALDPNPAHAGRALKVFSENGIECVNGILGNECRDLNFIFNHAIVKKEALIALKVAQTKNGKIAESAGKPSQITGNEARAHTMRYRKLFPSIGVGLGAVLADNPALTRRIDQEESSGMRLVFDRSLESANLNTDSLKVFSDEFSHKTHVVCDADASPDRLEFLRNKNFNLIQIPSLRTNEKAFWSGLKKHLYESGVSGLIVEGGAKILSSLAASGEADYMFEYTSPKVFPESALSAFAYAVPQIKNATTEILGNDVCRFGYL